MYEVPSYLSKAIIQKVCRKAENLSFQLALSLLLIIKECLSASLQHHRLP